MRNELDYYFFSSPMESENNSDHEKESKMESNLGPFLMESTQFQIKSMLPNTSWEKEVLDVSSDSQMESECLKWESTTNFNEEPWCVESTSALLGYELEETLSSNFDLENGLVYLSCDSATELQNTNDLDKAIEEELLWNISSTVSKDGDDLQDYVKDTDSTACEKAPELLTETQRSCTEALNNYDTCISTLSAGAGLQENDCLEITEDSSGCKTSDFAVQPKKNSDKQENNEVHSKVEVKEDTLLLDKTSTMKSQAEGPLLMGADVQNNVQEIVLRIEETNQESLSTESVRLCNNGCDVTSADLSSKACLKLQESTPCENVNMLAAHGDSTTEPSHNTDNPVYMLVFVPSNLEYLITQTHLCKICNKTFTTPTGLKSHILKHEEKLPYKCTVCEKSFAQVSKLKLHMISHDGVRPHKCNICNKTFITLSNLKEHNFIHEGESPHKCNICKKCFTTAYSLKVHCLIHEGKRPHKCNICEKTFTQASNLRIHNLIHEGKRPHKCTVCGKCFTVASKLKVHSLLHEGKRPHKCKVCDKSFIVASELNAHSLVHDRKGPNKCKVCEKSFSRPSMLKRHTSVHEEHPTYYCKICLKGFARAANLKNHTLTHEGNLPHRCEVCDRSFTHISKLRRHRVVHEGRQPNV